MNAPTPQPSDDDLEHRVITLEKKVDLQHHELTLLRQHIDNSIGQAELRTRIEIQASEQRTTDRIGRQIEVVQRRQEEQFRWLFGMLVVIFLSNSATIVTFITLLMKR